MEAISNYQEAIKISPDEASLHFRLGVALRRRYEEYQGKSTNHGQSNDFRAAVESWGRALELDPNPYIFRRRIQQYGPRLDKPYPFYDWIPLARKEITARGDHPVDLRVEPSGAEFAQPSRRFSAQDDETSAPDPKG